METIYTRAIDAITSYTSRLMNLKKILDIYLSNNLRDHDYLDVLITNPLPLRRRAKTAPEATYRKAIKQNERKSPVLAQHRPPTCPSLSFRHQRYDRRKVNPISSRSRGPQSCIRSRSTCNHRRVSSPAMWISPPVR